jgi:hypothetical protein
VDYELIVVVLSEFVIDDATIKVGAWILVYMISIYIIQHPVNLRDGGTGKIIF